MKKLDTPTLIILGKQSFLLVANKENIITLEATVGSVIVLANQVRSIQLGLVDIASIMAAVAEPRINLDEAMQLLLKYGVSDAYGPIAHFFARLLVGENYDPTAEPSSIIETLFTGKA